MCPAGAAGHQSVGDGGQRPPVHVERHLLNVDPQDGLRRGRPPPARKMHRSPSLFRREINAAGHRDEDPQAGHRGRGCALHRAGRREGLRHRRRGIRRQRRKRGEVSVGSGGVQGAVGASGAQRETGGASTDAPRVQVLSVTGRSGIFTISEPALQVRKAPMPFPVPRCCGDCARSGYLNASPRSALRRVPVAAGEKAAARAGAQDSSMRLNATTWSAHGRLKTVSESNRASAFNRLSNKQPLPCRHTLSRALPTPGASPQSAMLVRSRQRKGGCRPTLTCARRGSATADPMSPKARTNSTIVARSTAPITRSARLFA